jgi:hypothetical protein
MSRLMSLFRYLWCFRNEKVVPTYELSKQGQVTMEIISRQRVERIDDDVVYNMRPVDVP